MLFIFLLNLLFAEIQNQMTSTTLKDAPAAGGSKRKKRQAYNNHRRLTTLDRIKVPFTPLDVVKTQERLSSMEKFAVGA